MKKCFKCNQAKPLSEFYRHAKMGDGHLNKCKECTKIDVSQNYRENRDHYIDYERSRASLPHRVEARKVYAKTSAGLASGLLSKKRWDENNPKKKGASNAVSNAVSSGRLFKPDSCEDCGTSEARIHGHHDDYDKPLDVRWLCPACHSAWHKENGEGKNGHHGKVAA